MKVPVGREEDVGPGEIWLDGDPAPPNDTAPNFGPLLWPNGWLDQDATWYGGT